MVNIRKLGERRGQSWVVDTRERFYAEPLGGVGYTRLTAGSPDWSNRPGAKWRVVLDPESTGVPCRFVGMPFSPSLLGPA